MDKAVMDGHLEPSFPRQDKDAARYPSTRGKMPRTAVVVIVIAHEMLINE